MSEHNSKDEMLQTYRDHLEEWKVRGPYTVHFGALLDHIDEQSQRIAALERENESLRNDKLLLTGQLQFHHEHSHEPPGRRGCVAHKGVFASYCGACIEADKSLETDGKQS